MLNYLKFREFELYRVNTSTNGLVEKLIREGGEDIKFVMEDLLQDNDIRILIDDQIIYNQLDYDTNAVWSLLLAGGYLINC